MEHVEQVRIKIQSVSSKNQLSNILTKPLVINFVQLRDLNLGTFLTAMTAHSIQVEFYMTKFFHS